MKILYIHQYFNTPEESGTTRSYWIARELVKRGHQVTMLTSVIGAGSCSTRKLIDGIDVIYVKNRYSNYMTTLRKVLSFVGFVSKAIAVAMKEKDVDIVYATSTPLTVGFIALWLKKWCGWRYVFEVRDLWPEFPIQMGVVKNPLFVKALRWLECRIYQKAEHVVALSPGMKDGVVATGIREEKVSMVPNMSKPDMYYPHKPNMEIAKRFGIDIARFNVIHCGAMGRANGLQYLIDAARILHEKGDDDVNFIMMGGGAMKPLLKKQVKELGLTNMLFIDHHPTSLISEILNLSDVSIVSFLNLPILQTNSPNKLFDSLSAGKPIIVNSAGWTKDLVEQGNCGFYVDPEKPEQLVVKLLELKDNHEQLRVWGANARQLSIDVYDKDILTAQIVGIIEKY